jgi:hypothetical protein
VKRIHFFIVAIVILVLAAFGYFLYRIYFKSHVELWALVPENAIAVYENTNTVEGWNHLVKQPMWQTLLQMPALGQSQQTLEKLDSVTGKDAVIDRLFRNRLFLVSAHVIGSSDIDYTYYLDLRLGEGQAAFRKILDALKQDFGMQTKTRNYQGFELNEIQKKGADRAFSYFMHDNILIGSTTSFLLEDVIRNIQTGHEANFSHKIGQLQQVRKLENDEGNLYLDATRLNKLLSIFLQPDRQQATAHLAKLTKEVFLDVKLTENEILLNGVCAVPPNDNQYFLNVFKNQSPVRISITSYLPQRTALFYHMGFSDAGALQNAISKYWAAHDKAQLDRFITFDTEHDFDWSWMHGEVGMAILETIAPAEADQLMFIRTTNADSALSEMLALAGSATGAGDSVYYESYMDQLIYQLPLEEWPETVFGSSFAGFNNTYFTILDELLILGNKMQVIKHLLNEVDAENTWGKQVRYNLFLENTLSEASLSLFVNTSMYWNLLSGQLNERWQNTLRTHQPQLMSFDLMAFQVSNLDDRFYTSIAIEHRKPVTATQATGRFRLHKSAYTVSPITTKPFIVRNHNNGKFESLVQDSLNVLYLLSPEGEILWGDSLTGQVVTDIHQIDFYRNKKLQYIFAAEDKIYLLDRNGDFVEGFPLHLPPGVKADYLSVIDYDNSKRYRFMLASTEGDLYLYDKEKDNLEGWQPKALGGALSAAPFHIRVRGGDCMLAMQQNGKLNVINRRGEFYPSFPIDFETEVISPLFVDIGNDFSSTQLSTVSASGEILQVNLSGKILKREQLYKPSKDSRFWQVNDALNNTFIIVRQDYGQLSFLDRNGNLLFDKNFITSGDLAVQYYNFSTDNQIFVVVDRQQEFTYIYDQDGELINFEPLESGHEVGLLYLSGDKEYQVYKSYNNHFSVLGFR